MFVHEMLLPSSGWRPNVELRIGERFTSVGTENGHIVPRLDSKPSDSGYRRHVHRTEQYLGGEMPTRPTWSGSLQISLVSIAVKIFPATNPGRQVQFHL